MTSPIRPGRTGKITFCDIKVSTFGMGSIVMAFFAAKRRNRHDPPAVYRSFFGFVRESFSIGVKPPGNLYHSRATALPDYVLRLGAIGVLTDEVGAGKSTGLRFAASRLHPSKYHRLGQLLNRAGVTPCNTTLLRSTIRSLSGLYCRISVNGHERSLGGIKSLT